MLNINDLLSKETFKNLDSTKKAKLMDLIKFLEEKSVNEIVKIYPVLNKKISDLNLEKNEKREIILFISNSLNDKEKKQFESILKLMNLI